MSSDLKQVKQDYRLTITLKSPINCLTVRSELSCCIKFNCMSFWLFSYHGVTLTSAVGTVWGHDLDIDYYLNV